MHPNLIPGTRYTTSGIPIYPIPSPNPTRRLALTLFCFFILRRMGKNKALAHHTSTYFHTRRVSIQLHCFRSPTLAGAPFGSHCRYSVSCPYQWSSLQAIRRGWDQEVHIKYNTPGRGAWFIHIIYTPLLIRCTSKKSGVLGVL